MSGPIPCHRFLDSSCTYHIDLFSALGNVPVTRYGIRNFSKIQWLKTTTILSFFTCESGIPIELCWMMLLFSGVFKWPWEVWFCPPARATEEESRKAELSRAPSPSALFSWCTLLVSLGRISRATCLGALRGIQVEAAGSLRD